MVYFLLGFLFVVSALIGLYHYSRMQDFDHHNFDFDGYLAHQEIANACTLVCSACVLGVFLFGALEYFA